MRVPELARLPPFRARVPLPAAASLLSTKLPWVKVRPPVKVLVWVIVVFPPVVLIANARMRVASETLLTSPMLPVIEVPPVPAPLIVRV